jgi:hypothetical protein
MNYGLNESNFGLFKKVPAKLEFSQYQTYICDAMFNSKEDKEISRSIMKKYKKEMTALGMISVGCLAVMSYQLFPNVYTAICGIFSCIAWRLDVALIGHDG